MKKWWNWVLGFALICLLFVAVPLTLSNQKGKEELKPMFDEYIQKYNKSYKNKPDEYAVRFEHFVASVREIEELNAAARGPEEHRARYGLTRISDMSKLEYKEIHLSDERLKKSPHLYGKSWSKFRDQKPENTVGNDDNDTPHSSHQRNRTPCANEPHNNVYVIIRKKRATLPLKVDWRTKGVIGPVRDQGLCGACWAFSTVGTIESMQAIKTGTLMPLSVQEVIDCAGLGNSGCAGGDICLLLDWLTITNTAIQHEKDYPLRLMSGACKATKNATGVRISTFTCDDFVGAEEKILEALATHGPVTVAVNALTWQNYLGGVIQYHCSGAPADLNHAVQLVGYDLTAEVPYYIAKNSWGADYGNGGYLMLAVGTNICGLANEVATVDVL
ncbi:cathepsin O-like [Bombyx mandarina]|uniref:Cathepsin O-like n=1 Tax=Bombyx mandarina TaxID=7092 RepID=A0A6J2J7W4_BOMMA|nr:cathepsin O-like [Bombyx mandarina]